MKRLLAMHGVAWLAQWTAAFSLWLLFAGEWDWIELAAAAGAATVAASLGELARTAAALRVRIPLEWVRRAWRVPFAVVLEFCVVAWALALCAKRRTIVSGAFEERPFEPTGRTARGAGVRAWATVMTAFAPNSYVIDFDPEGDAALVHELLPGRSYSRLV